MNSPIAKSRALTDPPAGGLVRLRRGNVDWQVTRGWAEHLFDSDGLRLDHWIATGAATIVKTGPHRTVYLLDLPAGRFYLKHYKTSDWQSRLQNLFRPCKAKLEWNAAVRVADAGIATVSPIAVGRVLNGPFVADSFLITPEIGPAVSLHDFILNAARITPVAELTRFRQQLARRLGELVGRLHRHGLIHRDLHAGNILLRVEPLEEIERRENSARETANQQLLPFPGHTLPQTVSLWLIDLHAVSTRRTISLRKIERNLALLANFFSHFTTPADRRRFFQSYCREVRRDEHVASPSAVSGFDTGNPVFAATLRRVEEHCRQSVMEAHKTADRKWTRGNRRLIIADSGETECRGVSEFGANVLHAIRDTPERLFTNESEVDWIVRQPNHRLGVTAIEFEERSVPVRIASQLVAEHFAKHDRAGDDSFNHRHTVSMSNSRRAWEFGHALWRRGVDVLRPLLFVAKRANRDRRHEYLVSEHEPESTPLREWLDLTARSDSSDGETRIRRVINRLADQLRKMHAAGFRHTELSAENILIVEDSASRSTSGVANRPGTSHTRTIMLGLSAVRRVSAVSPGEWASILCSLWRSVPPGALRLTHRLRLLKRSLGIGRIVEWKPLWTAIASSLSADLPPQRDNVDLDTTSPKQQPPFIL